MLGIDEDVAPPNAIFGIYMRLDLMQRYGMLEKLYDETIGYFYPMAQRTGTLWEHKGVYESVAHDTSEFAVSCDHGFASYAATWLVRALCGFDGEKFCDDYIGKDCEFYLPQVGAYVAVKGGKRTIKQVQEDANT